MFDQNKASKQKQQSLMLELEPQQGDLNQEPSQLDNKKQSFLQSLLHPQQVKQQKKPIFIISPNFQQKHINDLAELLQKHNVPIQFQHETDSLGLQLNQHFFVVVDNHSRKMNLGPEFNSILMSIVGYPKIGANKKNIYCETPQQVYGKYRQFIATKTQLPRSLTIKKSEGLSLSNTSKLIRKQGLKQSLFSLNPQIKSSLNPQIKLKSINPYSKVAKEIPAKFEQCSIQNLSLLGIQEKKHPKSNLIFLQSGQNLIYNAIIHKMYGQIKISENTDKQKVFYFKMKEQVESKLNILLLKDTKDIRDFFIITSNQNIIKIIDMVNNKFTKIMHKLKLILLITDQKQLNYQNNKKLLTKCLKSKVFHSIETLAQKCQNTLKQQGFIFKTQKSIVKSQKDQTNIKKTDKKIAWAVESQSKGMPSEIVSNLIQNKIAEQIQEKNIRLINKDDIQKKQFTSPNEYLKNLFLETKSQTKNKCIIPSISSLLQLKNSQISQGSQLSKSSTKIIKILRKQKSQVQKKLTKQEEVKKQDILQDKNTQYKQKNGQIQYKNTQSLNRTSQLQNKGKIIDLPIKRVSNVNTTNLLKRQVIQCNKENSIQNLPQKSKKDKVPLTYKEDKAQLKRQIHKEVLQPNPSNIRKLKLFNPLQSTASHYYCTNQSILSPTTKKLKKLLSAPQQSLASTFPSKSCPHNLHFDGLIFTQYNQKIREIAQYFRRGNFVDKANVRSFYQQEYARTLSKVWTKGKNRNGILLLLDLQAFDQIIKYYASDAYEKDQISYYQAFKQQTQHTSSKSQEVIQGTNLKLLFFVVLPQKQLQNELFNKMKSLNERLPQYQIIKCVIEDDLDDNIMKQKSKYVYAQLQTYLMNQCKKHKHQLLQTI